MRIKPWMTTVANLLLLVAVQTETSGQQPLPPGGYPPGMVQGGYGPYVHQQPYATHNPQVLYPQGAPPEYQPWPQISPFQAPNVAMDQHYNRDGLWLRDILYRERKFFGSIELMSVAFRDAGNSLVGSPFATRAGFDEGLPLGIPNDINGTDVPGTGFLVADTRIIPFPALGTGANQFPTMLGDVFFPFHNTNELKNPDTALGTQIRWGFENEDGTGVLFNGFWAFEEGAKFSSGFETINGVPVTQDLSLALGGENLRIQGTLALVTGEPIPLTPEFGPGRTAKFDILFEMEHTTETAGTNFNVYAQPIYKTSGVKVRPLYGARYLYLNEGFGFRGIDSGFTYNIDDETFRPSTPLTLVHAQYEARLNSKVESHMAGPEIGFRFDFGKSNSNFKMWGETILGLHANSERITVSGDNIGDPLFEGRFENQLNPRMLDPAFQSEFSDTKSNVHISPVFQQSIFAEFAAFRSLPLIRNVSFLEDTSFRFGYTFLWAGEVSRPAEAIKWQGFPLFPEAQIDRTSWWMHQLNFGVDWTF